MEMTSFWKRNFGGEEQEPAWLRGEGPEPEGLRGPSYGALFRLAFFLGLVLVCFMVLMAKAVH